MTTDHMRHLTTVPLAPNDNVTEREAEDNRLAIRTALAIAASQLDELRADRNRAEAVRKAMYE